MNTRECVSRKTGYATRLRWFNGIGSRKIYFAYIYTSSCFQIQMNIFRFIVVLISNPKQSLLNVILSDRIWFSICKLLKIIVWCLRAKTHICIFVVLRKPFGKIIRSVNWLITADQLISFIITTLCVSS